MGWASSLVNSVITKKVEKEWDQSQRRPWNMWPTPHTPQSNCHNNLETVLKFIAFWSQEAGKSKLKSGLKLQIAKMSHFKSYSSFSALLLWLPFPSLYNQAHWNNTPSIVFSSFFIIFLNQDSLISASTIPMKWLYQNLQMISFQLNPKGISQ